MLDFCRLWNAGLWPCVMPYWPADRYLELAPKYWIATRARLDPLALAQEVGPMGIPPQDPPDHQPSN